MALLLDAGALIAYDRADRTVCAAIDLALRQQMVMRTTTAAVAQVWRDGARQARLARLLVGVDEHALGPDTSRRIGLLLAHAGTADVVDASIIEAANHGDEVLTSDPDDLAQLAEAAGKRLIIVPI